MFYSSVYSLVDQYALFYLTFATPISACGMYSNSANGIRIIISYSNIRLQEYL